MADPTTPREIATAIARWWTFDVDLPPYKDDEPDCEAEIELLGGRIAKAIEAERGTSNARWLRAFDGMHADDAVKITMRAMQCGSVEASALLRAGRSGESCWDQEGGSDD